MMLKALIVEQLEADGMLRTFTMQPSQQGGSLTVAFADDYDEYRFGPFHFLDESDARRFADGFAKCRARRVGEQNFYKTGSTFCFRTAWSGIPTERYLLSYYALSLPEYAILQQLSISDPHRPDHEYLRTVTRDDQRNRYVIYLECASSIGRFDFELTCDFTIDTQEFTSSEYQDLKSDGRGRTGDDWKDFLPEKESEKVQQFFVMNHNQEGSTKDFFISYNSADCQWAEWIAWQLEEAGYTTVLQAWDFRPGSNFVLEMQRAASEAERTITVLSQAYLDALYAQPEWAAAFAQDPTGEKGTLLPVRVRKCDLTGLLPQIVYIDLVGLEETVAKDTLLAGVRRERAKPTTPPGFPGAGPRSVPERPRFPRTLPLLDLKLLWRGDMATGLEGSSLVLETSEYNDKHFYLLLYARNDGEAMTAWYRLSFDIPRELVRPGSNLDVVQWRKGEQTCWSAGVSAEMTRHEFRSAGQYPLFPGDEVHIATLEVHLLSQVDYPDEVRIPYSVVTNKTQIQHGECMIRIRPENLTRKTPQQ